MTELWEHQHQTIDKLGHLNYGLDLSDPGTGKTAAHLGLYAYRPGRGRCLVTCPSTLMESAWADDIKTFFPELTFSLAYADTRFEAFELDTDVVIMNVDGVKAITQKYNTRPKLRKFLAEFDHLIMDEVDAYKHGSSQRSKAMLKISREIDHKFGLSATPTPQSVTELWHPMLIVDGGERLGTAFSRFRNSMQVPVQIGPAANHLRWEDKEDANEITMYLLRDIMVRHEFEKVMTHIPPNYKETKFIALPSKLMKQYDQLSKQMIAELAGGKRISVTHASSLRSKLLQLCSGAVYQPGDEEGEGDYILLDTFRYQLVADMVKEVPHSVTFFCWRHQRDELVKNFTKQGITFAVIDGSTPQRERPKIVADYQAGKYQTLLVHYKTGAHGLTLTRGTRAFIVSPIYEPNYFKQTIHRIYRGGQTEVTNTVLICARDTVEEIVYDRLKAGTLRMQDFLSMVASNQ